MRRKKKKKHPQVLQIPFTVLKKKKPHPPFLCPDFLHALSSLPALSQGSSNGEGEGLLRISAQFIKIPIVSSERSTAWPHRLRLNPQIILPADYGTHVTSCSHSPHGSCASPCKSTFTYCTSPFQPLPKMSFSPELGPSTNATIWLPGRPVTDLFYNLVCSVHCIGFLWWIYLQPMQCVSLFVSWRQSLALWRSRALMKC